MCGICGIYQYGSGEAVDEPLLRRMTAALHHRGPDDDGVLLDDGLGLGHRRLSIIDPSGGHQPLSNEDGSIWTVANGEIYNYRDLTIELAQRGHIFRTASDSEVIVHAYEEYGDDFLHHLNGMYGLALWDRRRRRLTLARDPFGIKPLYCWDDGRCVRFASELKAFLSDATFPRDIDPVALDQYLTFQFVPAPRTLFKAVQKLRPGHRAIVEGGRLRIEAFVREVPQTRSVTDERAAIAELQEHLRGAVERQMISDVPVGALLSGGVDSATVVALMRAGGRPVKTFTVGFAGSFAHNELTAARRSAEILGSEHHEVRVSARDCFDALPAATWHLDEPIATPSLLAMYWLSRLSATHVKVVLTGQGADEPWAGYTRYRGEKIGRWYRRLPEAWRRSLVAPLVAQVPRAETLKRSVLALGLDDVAERFTAIYAAFSPAMKRRLYRGDGSEAEAVEVLRYWQAPVEHLDPLAQQLYVETRLSLPDNLLMYGDKMSMAFGLEARVPLLDQQLMSFVESLPAELRLKGWSGHKYLYREAIRRWLPAEILDRPKIGFTTPMDEWLQGDLAAPLREAITSPNSACARYFHLSYIEQLIHEHVQRRENHTRPLFALLMFEHWHRRFVDAPTTASPGE